MGHEVSIGGNRLGSGNKLKAYLHNYERSTHDLSTVVRTTMACGTLVPFINLVALPGDTFDIDLNVLMMTHPTIGPLFGTYKVQLDIFQIPIRLYQGKLHMNMIGIGMDMSNVALPLIRMRAPKIDISKPIDNQQINPSSIFSYLGIRGLGWTTAGSANGTPNRQYNGVPLLGYWDIYKNYYANKQEEIGAVIHKNVTEYNPGLDLSKPGTIYSFTQSGSTVAEGEIGGEDPLTLGPLPTTSILIVGDQITSQFDPNALIIEVENALGNTFHKATDLWQNWELLIDLDRVRGTIPNMQYWYNLGLENDNNQSVITLVDYNYNIEAQNTEEDVEPTISTFPLANIDDMRKAILAHTTDDPFIIGISSPAPYGLALQEATWADSNIHWAKNYSQEGLALKTYQSDLFNNWISTEWIDGPDGISEITAIDTTGGSFTIDELNLNKKIYNMLNRIAISGGTYDDWLDAVYTEERTRSAENPMYLGGLIRNIVFQEVVSNAATPEQPLGTLAGRGRLGDKDKGGHVVAKIDEPSYIMGIISITPNIDYSQGNSWDVNLKTMNDFHKPALDAIGFQDLSTDQMAWWDTQIENSFATTFKSAGKQPAWINYMTNINRVYGNFADQNQQMFMVLNRRYTPNITSDDPVTTTIKDLTTYIDPVKFNHIFADTRRDAQNFWAQIGVNIQARRKMSAKVMPNL